MIKPAVELSPMAMEVYRRTARARARVCQERLEARRSRAWEVAHRAAAILKDEFGARQVALFGSLTGATTFHLRSDVDLAVWGLEERHYYRAVSRLQDLDPSIEVDLVEVEHARPSLRAVIEREGVIL